MCKSRYAATYLRWILRHLRVLRDVCCGGNGPVVDAEILRKIDRQIVDLQQAPQSLALAYLMLTRMTGRCQGTQFC